MIVVLLAAMPDEDSAMSVKDVEERIVAPAIAAEKRNALADCSEVQVI